MTKTIHGKVQGRTIAFAEDLGLRDGQAVRVQVTPVPPAADVHSGLAHSSGALANEWTDEDDRILKEIYDDRKSDTRREIAE